MQAFISVGHYVFSLVMALIFYSPIGVFRRKYPKKLTIDRREGIITLEKRKSWKPLILHKENLSFFVNYTLFYSVLDFYYEFLSSRGIPVKKRVFRIVAPTWLFSFNRKVVREIESDLKALQLKKVENKWRPADEHDLLD